jgi:hypothetical protein
MATRFKSHFDEADVRAILALREVRAKGFLPKALNQLPMIGAVKFSRAGDGQVLISFLEPETCVGIHLSL